jgi:hypothetical protein
MKSPFAAFEGSRELYGQGASDAKPILTIPEEAIQEGAGGSEKSHSSRIPEELEAVITASRFWGKVEEGEPSVSAKGKQEKLYAWPRKYLRINGTHHCPATLRRMEGVDESTGKEEIRKRGNRRAQKHNRTVTLRSDSYKQKVFRKPVAVPRNRRHSPNPGVSLHLLGSFTACSSEYRRL